MSVSCQNSFLTALQPVYGYGSEFRFPGGKIHREPRCDGLSAREGKLSRICRSASTGAVMRRISQETESLV